MAKYKEVSWKSMRKKAEYYKSLVEKIDEYFYFLGQASGKTVDRNENTFDMVKKMMLQREKENKLYVIGCAFRDIIRLVLKGFVMFITLVLGDYVIEKEVFLYKNNIFLIFSVIMISLICSDTENMFAKEENFDIQVLESLTYEEYLEWKCLTESLNDTEITEETDTCVTT